jgi:predicted NUDIX family NTP pyrophosphohydrolase
MLKDLLFRSGPNRLSLSVLHPGAPVNATIGDRVWDVPQDLFVAAWNAAATLDEATAAIRTLVGGPTPRWAVMARASALRKESVPLKLLGPTTRPPA